MHIIISRPTEEGISFAKAYLEEERDELPYNGPLTRMGVNPGFLHDLRNGRLDDKNYDIDLNPFSWTNYLIINRYLDKVNAATREANPMARMSRELGLSRSSYNQIFKKSKSSYVPLFVPNKKTKHGGKKRRIRARRTHRRRA